MTSPASSLPTAISVSTSQAWDNDGAGEWSTFIVNVGTPAQPAKVLISTIGYATWVVVGEGCPTNEGYPANCADDRGNVFIVENSTSWVNIGIFDLTMEAGLEMGGNGMFGRDTVALGYTGSGGPQLSSQIVGGIASKDFWLGNIGIDPVPANFTNLNDPQPSFLWNLRNESLIPSTSWGYTAGAAHRYNKVQASLTLGGYDASRFGNKNLTIPFYDDIQRRYIIGLNSIVYTPTGLSPSLTTTTITSQRISMLIDSTTPFIWLPIEACNRFADAFGLTYNNISKIYTINSTQHTVLSKMNPDIKFTFSNTAGEVLDITFPYAAFDLKASFPISQNETHYFPLKRAVNESQYTLGRVFLQEAYLIADHDRSEFTVAPCIWPATFKPDIKTIYPPPPIAPNNYNGINIIEKPVDKTPIAAIVGGVVGGIVVLLLAALVLYFFYWRPRRQRFDTETEDTPASTQEPAIITDANAYKPGEQPELEGMYAGAELPDIYSIERKIVGGELLGTPVMMPDVELEASQPDSLELARRDQVHEMAAREPVGGELSSSPISRRGDEKVGHRPFSWQ